MGKICSTCKEEKELSQFSHDSKRPDGIKLTCKDCSNKCNRKHYLENRKFYMKRRYNNMRQRATDNRRGSNAYEKPLMTYNDFWNWYQETKDIFEKMFTTYVEAGYDLTLAPSVDRIDSEKGYEIGNVQWLTQSENCSKGNGYKF